MKYQYKIIAAISIYATFLFAPQTAYSDVLFVDKLAAGANNGTSWTDAFTEIQNASDAATAEDQIWVAEESYSTGSSVSVLVMKAEVDYYGGFAGNEAALSERNPNLYPTILDGQNLTYHVVRAATDAVLDGFIIKNGKADGTESADKSGAGVYASSCTNLLISNCEFKNNRSLWDGTGIYVYGGNVDINNSVFTDNIGDCGAGVAVKCAADVSITNCTFNGNDASRGGAVYGQSGDLLVSNSILWEDNAFSGPEIYMAGGTVDVSYSHVQGGQSSIYVDTSATLNWGGGSFSADPLFVTGPFGEHYLSQVSAGQVVDSPCLNAGGDTAANLGLDDKTTSTAISPDTDAVDMGYHYHLEADDCWVNVMCPESVGNVDPINCSVFYNDLACTGGVSLGTGSTCTGAGVTDNGNGTGTYDAPAQSSGSCVAGVDIVADGVSDYETMSIYVGLLYVDIDATGAGTGLSWGDAFNTIQDAVDAATSGAMIWVAEGNYSIGTIDSVVVMKEGVDLYGGFDGSETALLERNPNTRPTILDGQYISYHVVTGASMATLDGFTIINGYADGSINIEKYGAGLYAAFCVDMQISNCTFYNNESTWDGAGVHVAGGMVYITNSIFVGNAGDWGGGLYVRDFGGVSISNCTFNNNLASKGGAIYNDSGTLILSDNILWGDDAFSGPEIYEYWGTITVAYSDIEGGQASIPVDAGASLNWGVGMIDTDPLFVDGPDGGYYLSLIAAGQGADSPCVDAGSDTAAILGLDDKSTLATNSPDSGIVDMGYHYYVQSDNCWVSVVCPESLGNIDPITCSVFYNYDECSGSLSVGAGDTCTGSNIIDNADGTGAYSANAQGYSGSCVAEAEIVADGVSDSETINIFSNVLFVDVDATGAGIGLSWTDAFTEIQDAVNIASYGAMIWVAEGTYSTGTTRAVIVMQDGVDIYGGFAGTETMLSERRTDLYPTILDGELSSYHVVKGASDAALDGFTIQNGNADGVDNPDKYGAGIYATYCNGLLIANCKIYDNQATWDGAGIHVDGGSVVIVNSVMVGNIGDWGGGMAVESGGNASITNCTFSGNSANLGGAFYLSWSFASLSNCILWGDSSPSGPEMNVANGGIAVVDYNDIQGGQAGVYVGTVSANLDWGTGNEDADPLFVGGGDYSLQRGSPSIDRGEASATSRDVDGNFRPLGAAVDKGAYEYLFEDECVVEILCASNVAETDPLSCPVMYNSSFCVEDVLSLGVGNTCTGASVSDNGNGMGSYDITAQGEAAGPGTCLAEIYIAEETDSDTITIDEINQAPSLTNLPGSKTVHIMQPGNFVATATDSDDPPDMLNFSNAGDDCSFTVNVATGGTVSWTCGIEESCSVNVEVEDDGTPPPALNDVQLLSITCGNGVPQITSIPPSTATENLLYVYNITCTDANGDPLTITRSAGDQCSGDLLDNGNGTAVYSGTPLEFMGGAQCVVGIDCSDTLAVTNQDTIISIIEDNQTPYPTALGPNPTVVIKSTYDATSGSAADNDVPNSLPTDFGYLTCGSKDNTCSFPVTVTGSGPGAAVCNLNFTAPSTPEICNVDLTVQDGGGLMIWYAITITIVDRFYVDADATGANNGFHWNNAFTVVQDAMDIATSDCEIWVAEGTYNRPVGGTEPVLTMKDGIDVYGGFLGWESLLVHRISPEYYPTILDGENLSYHTVIGASDARLDGFIVTGGNASGVEPDNWGGGMYNENVTNLSISKCIFEDNYANYAAGGMINSLNASPEISKCTFKNNYAVLGGGGILNREFSSPTITDCIFDTNITGMLGGGMSSHTNCTPIVINSLFINNHTNRWGGGISSYDFSDSNIINCTFYGNSADWVGGAIFIETDSSPIITNCVFWENTSPTGPEIALTNYLSRPTSLTISYSDIQGGAASVYIEPGCTLNWGAGNIDDDPAFINTPFFWDWTDAAGTTTTIEVADASIYLADDVIELDGDSVVRTVISASGTTVTFSPALSSGSTPGMRIENWGFGATDLDADFRLIQGQEDSPCVDTGSDTAANLGMDDKTTRTDNVADSGTVDMGFHYPAIP